MKATLLGIRHFGGLSITSVQLPKILYFGYSAGFITVNLSIIPKAELLGIRYFGWLKHFSRTAEISVIRRFGRIIIYASD